MKAKRVILILAALCLFGVTASYGAADASMGTWKLNEAKSKFAPGAARNTTVVYEAAGDSVKVTVDGNDSNGNTTHSEWTGKFDGTEYAVVGDATSDTRSYRKINDYTMTFTAKMKGKITLRGRIVYAADGKSRTVTTTATNAKGKKIPDIAVYDKQ